MPGNTVNVTFKGPLFSPRGRMLMERHMGAAVQTVIEKGEEELSLMLRPRPGGVYLSVGQAAPGQASTGHYRRSVHGERYGLAGRIHDSGVVYGPWLEGVSSRNATTRFKGYRSFRRVGQWLHNNRVAIVKPHVDRLLRELRGGI